MYLTFSNGCARGLSDAIFENHKNCEQIGDTCLYLLTSEECLELTIDDDDTSEDFYSCPYWIEAIGGKPEFIGIYGEEDEKFLDLLKEYFSDFIDEEYEKIENESFPEDGFYDSGYVTAYVWYKEKYFKKI